MNTRSKINDNTNINIPNSTNTKITNPININFDEASIAWRANKKLIESGHFKYKCLIKTQTGNECKREALAGCDACKLHFKRLK